MPLQHNSGYFANNKAGECVRPEGRYELSDDFRNTVVYNISEHGAQQWNVTVDKVLFLPYSLATLSNWNMCVGAPPPEPPGLPGGWVPSLLNGKVPSYTTGDCTHRCLGQEQHEPLWRSLRSIVESSNLAW